MPGEYIPALDENVYHPENVYTCEMASPELLTRGNASIILYAGLIVFSDLGRGSWSLRLDEMALDI